MPKRRGRVALAPAREGWDFRYATSDAVSVWDKVCAVAPSNARTAWERVTADPRRSDDRHHSLRGNLGRRNVNGEEMEQWHYDVTSGRRCARRGRSSRTSRASISIAG
jgi:hypothetical protein